MMNQDNPEVEDGVVASSEPFALPYHLDVGPDPGFDEMRKIVCVDGRRPGVHSRLASNKVRGKILLY